VARRSAASASPSGAASSSAGSTESSALRLRRRSSSSAALRAIPKSHARWVPRRGSNERCLRKARSKAAAVTSSAAERSRSSEAV
jgi:hypothetical protein